MLTRFCRAFFSGYLRGFVEYRFICENTYEYNIQCIRKDVSCIKFKRNMLPNTLQNEDEGKQLIQSWIMTLAKYGDKGFNTIEKRILYRITEMFQELFKENIEFRKKYSFDDITRLAASGNNKSTNISSTLFGDAVITMPLSAFEIEGHRNHSRIKQAFMSMMTKVFEYINEDEWEAIALIENPKIRRSKTDKRQLEVEFKLNKKIAEVLFDFSSGYRKFYLDVAFKLESPYSMRWYELFSQQTTSLKFSIERLRDMFQTGDKYKRTTDFVKNVIESSKVELDEKSDTSFNYVLLPQDRGRTSKVTGILFVPYRNTKNIPKFETDSVMQETSLAWYIDRSVIKYLKGNFGFTQMELKAHLKLFKELKALLAEGELMDIISKIRYTDKKGVEIVNRKGYLINTLTKIRNQKINSNEGLL